MILTRHILHKILFWNWFLTVFITFRQHIDLADLAQNECFAKNSHFFTIYWPIFKMFVLKNIYNKFCRTFISYNFPFGTLFLAKKLVWKLSFFNFYFVSQNTEVTISIKDTDEIFFLTIFWCPWLYPFRNIWSLTVAFLFIF